MKAKVRLYNLDKTYQTSISGAKAKKVAIQLYSHICQPGRTSIVDDRNGSVKVCNRIVGENSLWCTDIDLTKVNYKLTH